MIHGDFDYQLPSNCTNIRLMCGDIFDSQCQTLVNTVNCEGVMGKGLALEFKKRYPDMFDVYRNLCLGSGLSIGQLQFYKVPDVNRIIVNFPTKYKWRFNSKVEYLVAGLRTFVDVYKNYNIESVAFPMLGCNNGGLKMETVFPIMCGFLQEVDIPVEIWFWMQKPEEKPVETAPLF